jgi:hypothetical protein
MPPFATPQNTHYQGNGSARLSSAVGGDSQGPGDVQPHHSSLPVFSQVLDEISIQNNQARQPASITNQPGMFSPPNPGLPLYAMSPNGMPLNAPQVGIPPFRNASDPKSNTS